MDTWNNSKANENDTHFVFFLLVCCVIAVNQTFMNKKPDDGQGAFLVSALLHLETTNQ